MSVTASLATTIGIAAACDGMGVSRATLHRANQPEKHTVRRPRESPLALSEVEKATVLNVLHAPEHIDSSPHTIYAMLLDTGVYLASVATFYRILRATCESRPRRNQLVHPAYSKPELLATKPCEVWSWDITKLKGPVKSVPFHLYVILDIFSRYVVGWMIADHESAELAEALIGDTCDKQGITQGQLTLHADRGASMRSKLVADLLVDLGVVKSHSRPYVSDDNPFSESQFKTMKYRPAFPERFQTIEQARAFCQTFFPWYNNQHCHSGIGYVTPAAMHDGTAKAIYAQRANVLQDAFLAHPNRFKQRQPEPPKLPTSAGINMPKPDSEGIEKTQK